MTVPKPSLRLRFYRQCRLWHGYLSAVAFAALLFFAVTGLLLNHPAWFAANEPPSPAVNFTLSAAQVEDLQKARAPAELLVRIVAARNTLYGEFEDGEAAMGQVSVRLRGARGSSDIRANLRDGSVSVRTERATTTGLLNALHRGEHAGAGWRAFIDGAAIVLIVLSLVGYTIFFSMINKRLRTALLITAVSLIGTAVLFVALVR